MNKRVLVIVGLALIIAVSGGVIALNSGNNNDKNKADASSSTASEVDNGSDSQDAQDNTPDNGSSEPFVDGTTDVETNTDADFTERLIVQQSDEFIPDGLFCQIFHCPFLKYFPYIRTSDAGQPRLEDERPSRAASPGCCTYTAENTGSDEAEVPA